MTDSTNKAITIKALTLLQGNQAKAATQLLVSHLKSHPSDQKPLELILHISSNFLSNLEAIALLENCIGSGVTAPVIFYELGSHYLMLGKYAQSIASLKQALKHKPNYFEALHDLGAALALSGKKKEALESLLLAAKLNNQSAELLYNLGRMFDDQFDFERAIRFYQDAVAINPQFTEAWINLAIDLSTLKNYADALKCFEHAYALNPNINFLYGDRAFVRMRMCDWSQDRLLKPELKNGIENCAKVIAPFPLMALIDSPSLIQSATQLYARSKYPTNHSLGALHKHRNNKIRIGYFSADFHEHPVSYLTAEIFELHDRNQFEIYAFSFGKNTQDEMRKRLERSFDHFFELADKSELEIAQLSRELCIDIAIDLSGFTENARTEIFAFRAAPVQMSYIGYLGTMGCEFIDYLIADEVIIPPHLKAYYSEKILFLPCYQANDSKRTAGDRVFTKAEFGILEEQFVFCNLNNVYKITQSTFKSWMNMMSSVPNSVLILYAENPWATENLKNYAHRQGVDPSRLIFVGHLPRAEYLARYRIADLFLDTNPYNAGATASDALWMGVPVLTLQGNSFASRVASSLLTHLNLPELIAHTVEEYETQAVNLATQPSKLEAVKNKLLDNSLNMPLFNSRLFVEHLEQALTTAYLRYQHNLPLEDIYP